MNALNPVLRTGAGALLLAAGLVFPGAPVQAQPVDTAGATTCDTVGFTLDPDPKGTNVRSAPRADAPVIGRLQPRHYLEYDKRSGEVVGQSFSIIGSKDGWLLIRDVEADVDKEGQPFGAFAGPGWVSGRLVGMQLGAWTLRAAPRRDAPVIARMAGNHSPSSAAVKTVHGCQDKYVEVTAVPLNGKPLRGWSWKPCASQLTVCDRSGSDLDN